MLRILKIIKRKFFRFLFFRSRNKKDKKREKERDYISERRERECLMFMRKSFNDRDGKEKLEKNSILFKEKEYNKELDLSVSKEVDDKDVLRIEENKI